MSASALYLFENDVKAKGTQTLEADRSRYNTFENDVKAEGTKLYYQNQPLARSLRMM